MAGKTAKNRKQAVLDKIKALARAREINNLLAKGALQSEALQNAGEDRPADESHVLDLLSSNREESQQGWMQKKKKGNKPKKEHAS